MSKIRSLSEAKVIAKTLIHQVSSVGDPYWHIAGANTLATYMMLLHDISTEKTNYRNIINVKKLLSYDEEKIHELVDSLGSQITKDEFAQISIGSEKTKDSIKATALSAIELYSDESFREFTSMHDVDFDMLRKQKTVLYLIVPEEKIKATSSFLSVFYKQLFDYLLANDEGKAVCVMLEEFANTGYIPDFSQIITVARKRNVSISLIVQEIEQIETLYKGHLESIISGGCQNKLFFSGLGLKTSKYVSEMMGDETIEVSSETKQYSGMSTVSTSSHGRRLMTHDELRQLNSNQAIFISGNNSPMQLEMTPAYKSKKMSKILNLNQGGSKIKNGEREYTTILDEEDKNQPKNKYHEPRFQLSL